jgi:hypothetical protein
MSRSFYRFLFLLLLPILSYGQLTKNKEKYHVGYKTIHTMDTSRQYKPGTNATQELYYRPVDIDIWYPAEKAVTDSCMIYKDFLSLFVNRPKYYRDTIAAEGAIHEMAKAFCDMNKCSDTSRLLHFKTGSFKNVKPAIGKFPLVVYLASYGSNSFENFTLFEELTRQGFVVVSIHSIGRFPGEMTMKYEDVMQQVYDAVFSLKILSKAQNINFSKIGIMGYSWGGMAGSILAGKVTNAACLISLDGSEFHHYGFAKDEDADFDGITHSQDFKNITIPYLRLEQSPPSSNTAKKDSVYNFYEKLSDNNLMLKVNGAEHYHFCNLPFVVKTSGNCKDDGLYNTITKLTIAYLNDHLKKSNNFLEILAQEMDKTVRKK